MKNQELESLSPFQINLDLGDRSRNFNSVDISSPNLFAFILFHISYLWSFQPKSIYMLTLYFNLCALTARFRDCEGRGIDVGRIVHSMGGKWRTSPTRQSWQLLLGHSALLSEMTNDAWNSFFFFWRLKMDIGKYNEYIYTQYITSPWCRQWFSDWKILKFNFFPVLSCTSKV